MFAVAVHSCVPGNREGGAEGGLLCGYVSDTVSRGGSFSPGMKRGCSVSPITLRIR